MNAAKDRAARVVAYLEARTTANGCTLAEAEQARHKAAELRARYGLADHSAAADDLDTFTADERARVVSEYLDQLAALMFVSISQRKAKRRTRAVRFRWGTPYRR